MSRRLLFLLRASGVAAVSFKGGSNNACRGQEIPLGVLKAGTAA